MARTHMVDELLRAMPTGTVTLDSGTIEAIKGTIPNVKMDVTLAGELVTDIPATGDGGNVGDPIWVLRMGTVLVALAASSGGDDGTGPWLPLAGGTMQGSINLGGHALHGFKYVSDNGTADDLPDMAMSLGQSTEYADGFGTLLTMRSSVTRSVQFVINKTGTKAAIRGILENGPIWDDWVPLATQTWVSAAYLPLTGGTISGNLTVQTRLHLTYTQTNALTISRSDSPVGEWVLGDNTSGQLVFRHDGVNALLLSSDEVKSYKVLRTDQGISTGRDSNGNVIKMTGMNQNWLMNHGWGSVYGDYLTLAAPGNGSENIPQALWVLGDGDVMVGETPRKGSHLRNVSHSGSEGPPADMQPGDIHLLY